MKDRILEGKGSSVRFERFGGPDVLTIYDVPIRRVSPEEVFVEVRVAAVNHLDLDERAGTSGFAINAECQLGREGAGIIVDVGSNVRGLQIGDRVMINAYPPCSMCDRCMAGEINICEHPRRPGIDVPGTYSKYFITTASGVTNLPETVSFEQAACLQLSFGTAWHGLLTRGALQVGETVLITGAGGGVGSAALELASLAGAEVIAAAGSPERRDLARSRHAAHVVNSSDPLNLAENVLSITKGKGVGLIFDASGGRLLEIATRVLRVGGRYVVYGAHEAEYANLNLLDWFRNYSTLIATRGFRHDEIQKVLAAAAVGRISVPISRQLPLADASTAHRLLQDRQVSGKVVLLP